MAKRTKKKTRGRKNAPAARKRRVVKKAVRRAAPARGARSLGSLSTAELAEELRRRHGRIASLESKRGTLQSQIDAIDAEITTLRLVNGSPGSSPKERAGRGGAPTLAMVLEGVLRDNPLSVSAAADAAKEAGYKTKSSNFRNIVNQTLTREDRFKKVSRGVYTVV